MSYPMLPVGFPACALRDDWQEQPIDPHRRTEMDDGAQAIERKLHRLRTIYTITWELSGLQYDQAKAFWADTLDAGKAWVYAPVVEGHQTALQLCQFVSNPPWTGVSPAPGIFQLSFELAVRDLPRLSATEAAAVEVYMAYRDEYDSIVARYSALVDAWQAAVE